MGASIQYLPVKSGIDLDVGLRSDFISRLELPAEFTASDVPMLQGMLRAGYETGAIGEMIDAIKKHGTIKVWAEY